MNKGDSTAKYAKSAKKELLFVNSYAGPEVRPVNGMPFFVTVHEKKGASEMMLTFLTAKYAKSAKFILAQAPISQEPLVEMMD